MLDVATGTGFHSVQLLRAGFEVTSVDSGPVIPAKAFEKARRQGYILRTVYTRRGDQISVKPSFPDANLAPFQTPSCYW